MYVCPRPPLCASHPLVPNSSHPSLLSRYLAYDVRLHVPTPCVSSPPPSYHAHLRSRLPSSEAKRSVQRQRGTSSISRTSRIHAGEASMFAGGATPRPAAREAGHEKPPPADTGLLAYLARHGKMGAADSDGEVYAVAGVDGTRRALGAAWGPSHEDTGAAWGTSPEKTTAPDLVRWADAAQHGGMAGPGVVGGDAGYTPAAGEVETARVGLDGPACAA